MNAPTVRTDHQRPPTDAADRISGYAELSRAHALRGEVRLAVLAAWAADVQVLQALLWESGLGSAPDPDAQLVAVSDALTGSFADHAGAAGLPVTARESLGWARGATLATFDESVHELLAQRFLPLDHLDSLPGPDDSAAAGSLLRRLGQRSPAELVASLLATAGDCMAVARVLADEDDPSGAIAQARQADLVSFEAYLVSTALRVRECALLTVELRWTMAQAAAADASSHGQEFEQVIDEFRDRLAGVVGSREEMTLRQYFEPVTASPPRS